MRKLQEINNIYDEMQIKYGDSELNAILNGGRIENPEYCFIFMNPTKRNIATSKDWEGIRSPWIGTKNIWSLFYDIGLISDEIYSQIKNKKASEWDSKFASKVYKEVENKNFYITNLGKCSQVDARPLKDSVFNEYLDLLLKEIEVVNPKKIILFGNQVSSIVLNEKISVSNVRKQKFYKNINGKKYLFYSVYYPVGNGRFNLPKSVEDLKYIIGNED